MNKRIIIWIAVAIVVCACVIGLTYLHVANLDTLHPSSTLSSNVQLQDTESEPGSRKEIGEERKVRSWEVGGTTVTLYEQDLIVADEYYSGPATEQILKVKRVGGSEIVLGRYESGQDYGKTVEEVYISPLGSYVTAEVLGYESRYTNTYDARTGAELITPGSKKIPYWTHDEKKVALIQSAASIDGTPAAFFYSEVGDLKDAELLKEFSVLDYSLESVVQTGDLLTILMTSGAYGNTSEQKYILDLQTGTVTSK